MLRNPISVPYEKSLETACKVVVFFLMAGIIGMGILVHVYGPAAEAERHPHQHWVQGHRDGHWEWDKMPQAGNEMPYAER